MIRHPELRDKYLAVCGSIEDRHGVVLAKNYKAKACGVKTGMNLKDAYDLCPDLYCVEADFSYYLFYSRRVREIYYKFTDLIEPFGIDEAWLDVTHSGVIGTGKEIADKIREEVRVLGLTASVGVSFNKIFAKLGSDLKKPDATTVISKDNFKNVVWPLDCAELLMVGRKTAEKLKKYNITTIGDIARSDVDFLTKQLGKWGGYLYDFAWGNDASPVKRFDETEEVKSIGNSMTCYRDLVTVDDAKVTLLVLCDSVSARVIDEKVGAATTLSISVRDQNLNWLTRQTKLEKPTVLSEDFYKAALALLIKNHDFSLGVRSLGVTASGFTSTGEQLSIFYDNEDYDKRVKLADTVGKIRKKFGTESVLKARNLTDRKITREDPKNNHVIHPEGFKKK
ncbi:MAG: DNA polymerase IV [Clostridia bacterium]|nr:DNA polymerase IV [Clostridia bacterium]